MFNILIDSATIHSAASIFTRIRNERVVREINIVALDDILEAFVLNDSLHISSEYWNFWIENTPQSWHPYFQNVFFKSEPIQVDLNNFKKFISSEMVYFLLNTFLHHIKNKSTIYYDFLTYTGTDFGNYGFSTHDLHEHDKLIKEKWDWQYNHANKDHIDTIMMAYRTIEYINNAEKNRYNLLPHPIRNEFINEIGYAYGFEIHRDYNIKAYKELHKKLIGNLNNTVASSLSDLHSNRKLLWSRITFPFLSAIIYEKSSSVNDIFSEAYKLREKLSPFRERINVIKELISEDKFEKADQKINQLTTYIDKLALGRENTKIDMTLQGGFPFNFALGITPKIETPKYLRIFTDLNKRFSLPTSYIKSCTRLFPHIRWNKKIRDDIDTILGY